MTVPDPGTLYWDAIAQKIQTGTPLNEWRYYMRSVYRRLLRNWVNSIDCGRGLKTDLFEEAVTPYDLLSEMSPQSVGIDCSQTIARATRSRLSVGPVVHPIVAADLRRLPFQSGVFQYILSGSSLDHFARKDDIAVSLSELSRVLAPRGVMVITLDNPHNPLIRLRNSLPFAWLERVKLVPYYVGATYNRAEAREQFNGAGLTVTEVTAVVHAPRVLAIWLVTLAERLRWARLETLIRSVLEGFERLERLPTRFYTGYYLAFRVEKLNSVS
jgi:SAM-dependent methyltransferase